MEDEVDTFFNTLVIKHLPHQLTKEEKINFLRECGATDVNVVSSKINKYSLAFAKFCNHDGAKRALEHLHQRKIMGSYLVCEYARNKTFTTTLTDPSPELRVTDADETETEALLRKFKDKLNHWTTDNDFRIPVPSHLRYSYPAPTQQTVHNIACMLATSPKFYTQVLHLMNKMNLPCPIDTTFPASFTSVVAVVENPVMKSESESEISSDEEISRETVPDLKQKVKKTIKRPKIIKPTGVPYKTSKKMKFDEVFEDPKNLDKPIKRKLTAIPFEAVTEVDKEILGFGFIEPINPSMEPAAQENIDVRNDMEEERLVKSPTNCITLEALAANRISEKDRKLLPVFNNYAEGVPFNRIYVKNLAKQTTPEDLRFIFSAFLTEEESTTTFDIRLMQEGRMKGQAFVTLQTTEMAKKALQETNGYILNDRPMVVQFARNNLAQKQNLESQSTET